MGAMSAALVTGEFTSCRGCFIAERTLILWEQYSSSSHRRPSIGLAHCYKNGLIALRYATEVPWFASYIERELVVREE